MATSQAVLDKKKARQAQMAQANTLKTAVDIGKSNPFILPESKPTSIATRNYSTSSVPSTTPVQTAPVNNPATPTTPSSDETYWRGVWQDPVYARSVNAPIQYSPDFEAKGEMNSEFVRNESAGYDVYGENNPLAGKTTYKSAIQEEIDKRARESLQDLEMQNERQRLIAEQQRDKARLVGDAAMAANTAAFSPGREGVMSGTALMSGQKANALIQGDLQSYERQVQGAQAQRDRAEVLLNQAIEDQQIDLIEDYRARLSVAEQNLEERKAAQFDRAIKANEDTRANLESFTALVNDGQELSVSSIMGFANKLGVSFEDAYGYYEGVQNVRDDKNLSLDEKIIANDQALLDLQDSISGGAAKAKRQMDGFNALVKLGYSSDDAASIMDLQGSKNPKWQAEQRVLNAKATLDEALASGTPIPGSLDDVKLRQAELALREAEILFDEEYGVGVNGGVSASVMNEFFGSATPTQAYGAKIDYDDGGLSGVHDGEDFVLAGGKNADVRTPVSGEATVIPNNSGWGNRVLITDSNGYTHELSHLDSHAIKNGDYVTAGQIVGKQGNTGFTKGQTGIHVHYGVQKGGKYVDPKQYLNGLQKDVENKAKEGSVGEYIDMVKNGESIKDVKKVISENIQDTEIRAKVLKEFNEKVREPQSELLTESEVLTSYIEYLPQELKDIFLKELEGRYIAKPSLLEQEVAAEEAEDEDKL